MSKLSNKDQAFREEALSGSIWPLIVKICFPLALFQGLNQLFNIIDTLMASHISSSAVSTVVYLVQFNNFIAAIGTGLAVGGSITISHAYGAGDFDKVKQALSTVLALVLLAGLVVAAMLPFSPFILRVTGTPEEFISEGSQYFAISILSQVLHFVNVFYISVERTRGKSRKILSLNMLNVILKLSLTAIFVYLMNGTIIYIAIASLISNATLSIIALYSLFRGHDVFSFSFKSINFHKRFLFPIIKLAFPSMVEKMAFSYGKGAVNKMASNYGTDAVGAAGISNNMSGLLTGLEVGFQDGGTSLLGQVYGAKDQKRLEAIYRRIQELMMITAIIGFIVFYLMASYIATLFSISKGGYDESFHNMIVEIYRYELFGTLLLSLNYAATAYLIGTGRTKLTLLINFARIFIFRLPVIWAFQRFSHLGYEAVGYTMAISNALTGIFSFIVTEVVIRKDRGRKSA